MTLRDISKASDALSLLEQARQRLLEVGDDKCADFAEKVERLYEQLANATERQSGLKWSDE